METSRKFLKVVFEEFGYSENLPLGVSMGSFMMDSDKFGAFKIRRAIFVDIKVGLDMDSSSL